MKNPLNHLTVKAIGRWFGTAMLALFVFGVAFAGEMTPFKGSGSGTVVASTPGIREVVIQLAGSGQSTHLGQFSWSESLFVSTETGAATGTITFVAADGSSLVGLVTGQFNSPSLSPRTLEGTYTKFGGTGRFADSTGEANFLAVSFDSIHVDFAFDGLISK